MTRVLTLMFATLAMASGCKREAPAPAAPAPAPSTAPVAATQAATAAAPADVMETDPRYIVGISYPPGIARHPGLAAELRRYADSARGDLMDAVAELGDAKPEAPYDLSLSFNLILDTPRIVAVAADGSSYTGGAHGNPLVARFVWLPVEGRLLRSEDLIRDAAGWDALSAYVREQLHAALSQRVDADELPAAERADIIRSAGKLIDEGSEADAEAFRHFEPVLDGAGRISALRFVFPPYQVGPYADGTQTVEVPANVLVPHVVPAYRALFAG